jgi:uncharacterized protein DUF6491
MKIATPIAAALAAAAAAVTLAVSATAQPPPAKPAAKPAHACFWRREISNFAAHDDEHLYVRVGVHDVWELKLFSHCFDLDWVHRVELSSIGGFEPTLCEGSNPGVDVLVRDVAGRQRCPIVAVRKLGPADVAALPKDARP